MAFLNTAALNKIMDALMSRDEAQCLVAQSMIVSAKDALASPGLREEANDKYGTDDIEIDDEPGTSPSDDGVWVAAWVYLPNPDCPSCGMDMVRGEALCEDCRSCDDDHSEDGEA